MKRSTLSLLATAAILAIGGALLWFVFSAKLKPAPARPPEPPPAVPTEPSRNSALNVYITAPPVLPDGAARAELTLIKASLVNQDGTAVTAFQGAQRVMLQAGVVQKALSERVPQGRWKKLVLEFSPAAELAYPSGAVKAALVGNKIATLGFDAEVALSGSLAVFAALPLEPKVAPVDGTMVADVSDRPADGQTFSFGAFLLDERGKGKVFMIQDPTLVSVIKADVGFDISRAMKGSSGFTPAEQEPQPQQPQ